MISALFFLFLSALVHQQISTHPLLKTLQQGGGGDGQQNTSLSVINFNGSVDDFLASNQSSFGNLSTLLNLTNLSFGNSTNITLFAPNNQAFASLPQWLQNMSQNSSNGSLPFLQALLLYHVHPSSDFTPQNLTSGGGNQTSGGGNQTSGGGGTSSQFSYYPWFGIEQGNNTSNQSTQVISLDTALPPLNLTIYSTQGQNQSQQTPPPSQNQTQSSEGGQTQQQKWWVNDAVIVSAINTTNGYIFELSKVVTPLYYLNSSIYDIQTPLQQLPSNYTFPPPSQGELPSNYTRSSASMDGLTAQERNVAEAMDYYYYGYY
jgi:uncharacterized surface protein with fasciclin (FAS1) repeats